MTTESANCFVLAEMRTHHFTFQGTGEDREAARRALLHAWQAHRNRLVQRYPECRDRILDEKHIESRFRISYQEMGADACYPAISPGTGARP